MGMIRSMIPSYTLFSVWVTMAATVASIMCNIEHGDSNKTERLGQLTCEQSICSCVGQV